MIDPKENRQILDFLTIDSTPLSISGVPKEASVRNYYRIHYSDRDLILCIDENLKNIPYDFLEVQKFLNSNGIPVPAIIQFDPAIHAILQTDAGAEDLTSIKKDEEYISKIKESLDIILKLQELEPINIIANKSFHFEKLMFEINLTGEAYSRFKDSYQLKSEMTLEFRGFLEEVARFLANYENKVICHRDFHARNIMLQNDWMTLIDFQDMMMGVPQYDLASIIYDAYRPLSLPQREELYNYFKERSSHKNNRFREYYLNQCLQRSFKALGTYLIQFHDKKNLKFKESISAALENLMEICQLGVFPDHLYIFFKSFLTELKNNKEFC